MWLLSMVFLGADSNSEKLSRSDHLFQAVLCEIEGDWSRSSSVDHG